MATRAGTRRIAIIQGHPDSRGGHYSHALAQTYGAGANEAGHEVHVIDVGALDFPLVRSRADLAAPVPEVIHRAQQTLIAADHVALFFPIWNGGMPAFLLGFFEQAFRQSFVFPDMAPGRRGTFSSYFTQRKGLAGRTARVVVTMQMPASLYRWYLRPHQQKNVLRLSGLSVRETCIGRVEASDPRRRAGWLALMRTFGRNAR